MGNNKTFGTGRAEATMGIVARLVLMVCTILNLFALLIAGVRGTAVKTERGDDVYRYDRLSYSPWSIQPLNRSASSAHPFTPGRPAAKSKNAKPDLTGNVFVNINDTICFFLNKIVNIGSRQNISFGRRDIVKALGNRAPNFGDRSANPTLSHIITGGGKSAARAEGYLIPT